MTNCCLLLFSLWINITGYLLSCCPLPTTTVGRGDFCIHCHLPRPPLSLCLSGTHGRPYPQLCTFFLYTGSTSNFVFGGRWVFICFRERKGERDSPIKIHLTERRYGNQEDGHWASDSLGPASSAVPFSC